MNTSLLSVGAKPLAGDAELDAAMQSQVLLSNALLFLLIAGMAGSCDAILLKNKFTTEWKGIVAGVISQYGILPFLGFLSLKIFPQDPVIMITLLVVCTSPGGGFSGWWCSLANADLALSIAMTSASTLVCTVLLPLNVWLYSQAVTPGMAVDMAWDKLFISVIVVMCAVLFGSTTSYYMGEWLSGTQSISAAAVRQGMNTLGSIAGVCLMIFGGASNASSDTPLWENDTDWFICVGSPCLLGLASAVMLAFNLGLRKEAATAVAIECCYQNTGLALTIALSAVPPDKVGMASGVPIFYGIVEIFCVPTCATSLITCTLTRARTLPACAHAAVRSAPVPLKSMHRQRTAHPWPAHLESLDSPWAHCVLSCACGVEAWVDVCPD